MTGPLVEIHLDQIEENSRVITGLCRDYGIEVTGVTKVSCGTPQVAQAMIRGGITMIGESRLENIHRLRAGGITMPVMLLRIPPLSAAEEIVRSVDISLNSEPAVIRRLSEVALSLGSVHDIILMVDLGDLREGIWPDDLMATVREVREYEGVRIRGLGTNLTCYGGVIPSEENLGRLTDYAKQIEDRFGQKMEIISGGNSSSLELLAKGRVPRRINNLRIGEAILLGRETVHRSPWPGTSQKAFILSAELIEKKKKPSVPIGETGQDAFGDTPVFEDRGNLLRGILNIGREDVDVGGLHPIDDQMTILGASSDHLLIDITNVKPEPELGARIGFVPQYSALVAAMTSSYVGKKLIFPPGQTVPAKKKAVLAGSLFVDPSFGDQFDRRLKDMGYDRVYLSDGMAAAKPGAGSLGSYIRPGVIPIVGGSALSVPAVEACAGAMKQFGLLWVDSVITGEALREMLEASAVMQGNALDTANLVLFGVREIDPSAAELIRSKNICVFTMEDISLLPIRELMRQSLNRTSMGTEGLVLRFAPRAADNGNDGLTNREVHTIMEVVASSKTLRLLLVDDLSPVDPESPWAREGRELSDNTPRFILSALGKRILPESPPFDD